MVVRFFTVLHHKVVQVGVPHKLTNYRPFKPANSGHILGCTKWEGFLQIIISRKMLTN